VYSHDSQSTVAKIREAQGAASFDTFEVMAMTITFLPCPSLHELLRPVLEKVRVRVRGRAACLSVVA
jgi:hypothetical protein